VKAVWLLHLCSDILERLYTIFDSGRDKQMSFEVHGRGYKGFEVHGRGHKGFGVRYVALTTVCIPFRMMVVMAFNNLCFVMLYFVLRNKYYDFVIF